MPRANWQRSAYLSGRLRVASRLTIRPSVADNGQPAPADLQLRIPSGLIGSFCVAAALLVLNFAPLAAEDLNISASVSSQNIGLNEQLTLTISASGSGARLPGMQLPPLDDFDVYSSGTSQNVSFVNGKMSAVSEHKYILVPKRTGRLTIPSFQIEYKGKTHTTPAISVEVRPVSSQVRAGSGESPRQESFWIEQKLDKASCYTGEPVYYSFLFYADRNLVQNPGLSLPSFNGFLKEDLPPPLRYNKVVDGRNYSVTEIKSVIFPITKGAFQFEQARLEIVESSFPGGNNDFFAGFFGGGRRKVLQSGPLRLDVKSLPQKGKPDNYRGAVGRFSASASTDKKTLRVGEAVNLTLKIEGEGNISSLAEPDFPDLANFRRYDIISSQQISKDNYKITGSKTFQLVLVPRVEGEQMIPELEYPYFDPSSGKYEAARTKEIRLKVGKAALGTASAPENLLFKELGKDIRYIKAVRGPSGGGFIAAHFVLLSAFPAVVFFMLLAVKHRVAEKIIPSSALARGTAFSRYRAAILRLPSERELLCGGIENALFNFIRERSNAPRGCSPQTALAAVSKTVRDEFAAFVRKCQSERFSPSGCGTDPSTMKEEALVLLKKLKKHL
ncbi:BatD family protein [bacterium]|nr:BatD family protein [bacterium]